MQSFVKTLGTLTFPVESVMKEYDLQGMRLTQFVKHEMPEHPYRCCNIVERSWAMVGTHDNEPISMWADSMINTHEGYLNVVNLVDDMYSELQGKDRDDLIVKLTTDAKALMNVKLAEIFASKAANVQVFFTDFFGIKATYNTPGTSGDKNWSLRVPDNFEEVYCSNCKDGLALNLPLILKMAIEARGTKFAKKQDKLLKELEKLI